MTSSVTLIAETNDEFDGFAPYVASIDDDGCVAFQATLRGGCTGIFASGGDRTRRVDIASKGEDTGYVSHPDIAGGALCAFLRATNGEAAVVRLDQDRKIELARTGALLTRIGPLGPTMNEAGQVAFRADASSGAGIFVADREGIVTIAGADRFASFHGLPVIDASGDVVFRADERDGTQGIYTTEGSRLRAVVDARGELDDLGRFPFLDDDGGITFVARRRGVDGIFVLRGDVLETVVDTSGSFESVRGGLRSTAGSVFYATPRGGRLGIYVESQKLLALGDAILGARIADLALNPVSINRRGQLAVRLALDDGRQAIVRVEPP